MALILAEIWDKLFELLWEIAALFLFEMLFMPFVKLIRASITWLVPYEAMALPFVTLGVIGYVINNDDLMRKHKMKFMAPLLCFWAFSFFLILRKACELKRKPYSMKKRVEDLYDMDFQHTTETEIEHYYSLETRNPWTLFKNLILNTCEFCTFRPAYGMYFLTVFIYLGTMQFFFYIADGQEDPYHLAGAALIPPAMMISLFIIGLANTGWYSADLEHKDYYEPFDESVSIPMKVLVRKAAALFISAGKTHAVFALFVTLLLLLCTASADFIWTSSSANEVLKTLFLGFAYEPKAVVKAVLTAAALSCALVLIGMIISTFAQVKRNVLGTIEKNFERNMVAIRFLLRDTETETLADLKKAFFENTRKAFEGVVSLTEDEKKAFRYIHKAIWMSKQPFGGRWREAAPDDDVPSKKPGDDFPPEEQPIPKDRGLVKQDKGFVREGLVERMLQTEVLLRESRGGNQSSQLESRGGNQASQLESRGGNQASQLESRGGNQASQLESAGGNQASQLESGGGNQASQQEYEARRLRQRRPEVTEPSTLEDTPAGTVKSRRRKP